MDGTIFLIFVLGLLLLMSAYFSATETAFSSLNRIRIKNLANEGNKRAALVLHLSENYDQLLSTILIGNNIVNIASASIATVVFTVYCGDSGVTISTIVMTILVLIFGEISPKSLSKEAPEKFAMMVASSIHFFIKFFTPLNFLFMAWKKLLSKLFRFSDKHSITDDELITIIEEAEQEGGIDAQEGELIRSAIEFNDLEVADILTPRVDVAAISDKEEKQVIGKLFLETGYSRLPVYHETIDTIIGIINEKDFHNYVLYTDKPVESIIKPAVFVAPTMKISKLLKLLQKEKAHIAVITDEYGGTMGIVTLEDVIEELVGEIWDEHDEVVAEFQKISEKEYKIRCSANLDKMFKLFGITKEYEAMTVSGWVMREINGIPQQGDCFTFENLHVTVSKTDGRRPLEISVIEEEIQPEEAN